MPHVRSARSRSVRSRRKSLAGGIGACIASLTCGVATSEWNGDDVPELLPPIDGNPAATTPLPIDPARVPIVSIPTTSRPLLDPTRPSLPILSHDTIVPPAGPVGQVNAVLAVPGMGAPVSPRRNGLQPTASVARPTVVPEPAPATQPDSGGEPTLNGPLEMPDMTALPRRPGTVEPDDAADPMPGRPAIIPEPIIEEQLPTGPTRSGRSSRERAADRPPVQASAPTVTPVPRRGRFFGLFPAPLAVPPSTLVGRSAANSKASARAADEVDPKASAAQAALKSRIEKQARSYLGDRARSIEVQVDQRDAIVRARGVSLFQKRAVRRTIESLPALCGLRTTIEVEN